ncbi:hypothetical protein CGRA01v4_01270 [Colletotrichum graminicola]|nr:hypothetical protein CGRA01v4_01270 [Colletotrichum graminicola]
MTPASRQPPYSSKRTDLAAGSVAVAESGETGGRETGKEVTWTKSGTTEEAQADPYLLVFPSPSSPLCRAGTAFMAYRRCGSSRRSL